MTFDRKASYLAMSAALLSGVLIPAAAHAGEVKGTVTDYDETRALQSAEVVIEQLGRTTRSERDGRFYFHDVPAGEYDLTVRYVGAVEQKLRVTVSEEGTVNLAVKMGVAGEDDENTILVIGQYANQASSLSRQRESDGVSSVLTRDAIGQFPDQNVAESVRRLPGVNVLNDQGEGRFVSIRGLDPELNSSSLNGVRLPSPESDIRAVALDVVSSDIIESIEIKKSLTPDMDADTIGGSIELKTTSAFDRKKDFLSARLEGSYNKLSDQFSPKAGFDFSHKISDNAGVSGGFSWYDRDFSSDNVEADDWDEKDGIIFAEEIQYRDYDVNRQRLSGSLNFDFRLTEDTDLYLRGIYSQFDDHEYRRRLTFGFDAAPDSGTATSAQFSDAGLDIDDEEEIKIERDLKDRFERQIIRNISLGGVTDTGDWKIDYSASWAKSSEREKGSVDPIVFVQKFENGDNLGINFDYSNPAIPGYSITAGADDFFNAGNYEFDELEHTTLSDAQDEEYAFMVNVAREIIMDNGVFTVKTGGKARLRDKSYNLTLDVYDGFDRDEDLTLAEFAGPQTYGLADIEPVPNKTGAKEFFRNNQGQFELDALKSIEESNVEDYTTEEDIYAAYLLGRWENEYVRIIGGLRMEHTRNNIGANIVELLEEEEDDLGNVTQEEDVRITPINTNRSYTNWLPSFTIRYQASEDVILRLAGSRSLVRPKLSQLAPRTIVEDNEAEFGNPNLKPFKSWNLDVAAEFYYGKNSGISAGFFYKDIKDYTAELVDEDGGVFNGIAYDEAKTFINGPSAEVYGFEASWSQSYDFLPAPFNGLLTQFNYTYTNAKGDILEDGEAGNFRTIALPASSKNTFNAVIGYEKGPFSFRVAGTYRDKYLDELGGKADEDRYVDNHFQLDISAKLKLTDNIRIFAEAINITDEPYFAYRNFEGSKRLLQYEAYDFTLKFGVKADF